MAEKTALDGCHACFQKTPGVSFCLVAMGVELHGYNQRRRQPRQVGGEKRRNVGVTRVNRVTEVVLTLSAHAGPAQHVAITEGFDRRLATR